MDGTRFDRLIRALGDGRSRRSVLSGAAAAMFGLIAVKNADARFVCREQGVVCSKDADCCNQACAPRDRTGRRYCAECGSDADCQEPTGCFSPVCVAGVCDLGKPINGAACFNGDRCSYSSHCDETGACITRSRSDCTEVECQIGTCNPNTGSCDYVNVENGTQCSANELSSCLDGVCTISS
jgi:hypothetical protein